MAEKQTHIQDDDDYLQRVGIYFTEKKAKKARIAEWKKKRDDKLPDIETFNELLEYFKERKDGNKEKQEINLKNKKKELAEKAKSLEKRWKEILAIPRNSYEQEMQQSHQLSQDKALQSKLA